MSCYEWERGDIKLPKAAWPGFRKALIQAHNDEKMKLFNSAVIAHERLTEGSKGLRGENRLAKQIELLKAHVGKDNWIKYDDHFKLLFAVEEGQLKPTKLVAPKKKDLGLLPLTADCAIHACWSTIYLRNDTNTVIWRVPEGNRVCDDAREEPVARKLFELLDKVEWTRGSGGSIVGNDEYNRDADWEGGGGNYVKMEFGPERSARQGARILPLWWSGNRR